MADGLRANLAGSKASIAVALASASPVWVASSNSPSDGGTFTAFDPSGANLGAITLQQQPSAATFFSSSLYFVDITSNFLQRFDPVTEQVFALASRKRAAKFDFRRHPLLGCQFR